MSAVMPSRITVWLDGMPPNQGAFGHALQWALRLGVPLRAIAPTQPDLPGRGELLVSAEDVQGWVRECEQAGVLCSTLTGQAAAALDEADLDGAELWVVGGGRKAEILRQSLRHPRTSVLACPRACEPVSRVLILNQWHNASPHGLDLAGQLCEILGIAPVVLTVGRSEREVRQCQRFAAERLADHHLPATHDSFVGCDVLTAVGWLARWRRCSHIFIERHAESPWLRWLHRELADQLLALTESFALLALPDPAVAAGSRETRPGVPATSEH